MIALAAALLGLSGAVQWHKVPARSIHLKAGRLLVDADFRFLTAHGNPASSRNPSDSVPVAELRWKGKTATLVQSPRDPAGTTYLVRPGKRGPVLEDTYFSPPSDFGRDSVGQFLAWDLSEAGSGRRFRSFLRESDGFFRYERWDTWRLLPGGRVRCDSLTPFCKAFEASLNLWTFEVAMDGCAMAPYSDEDPCPVVDDYGDGLMKPMVYLYPKASDTIEVRIGSRVRVTSEHPARHDGKWRVLADPDGRLRDLATGREYYGLFWEGVPWRTPATDTGHLLRGDRFGEQLDSILELRGLSYREREEFVTFWLPRFQRYPWVSVEFHDSAYAAEHPVEISPRPDLFLRVCAVFRGLREPRALVPPKPVPVRREGFVAVEWGGQDLTDRFP